MPTFVLQPTAACGYDTMMYSASPTTNYGTNAAIQVGDGSTGSSNALRGIVSFLATDITGVQPSGTTLVSAALELYETGAGTTRSSATITDTANLHRVLPSVVEAKATYYISSSGVNWNASGCAGDGTDRVAVASSSTELARSTGASGWRTWKGLRADVQLCIDGSASITWLIQCPTKEFIGVADTDYRTFASSDYATDATLRPRLVLGFASGPHMWWLNEG